MKELSNQYVKRVDHVVWKEIEGKGILLNLENGSYFEVGPVGLAIWQHCDGKTPYSKIAQNIAKKYETDLNRVGRDLKEFVSELKKLKIAELLDEPEKTAVGIN